MSRLGLAVNLIFHLLLYSLLLLFEKVAVTFHLEMGYGSKFALLGALRSAISPLYSEEYQEADVFRNVSGLVRAGDTVVDVGGYVGFYSFRLARSGARVLCIEPHPLHYLVIAILCIGLKVKILNIAAAERKTHITIPSDLSSSWWGSRAVASALGIRNAENVEIQAYPLDCLPELASDPITLIKIDVEGAEASVIRGSAQVLIRTKHVFVEWHWWSENPIPLLASSGFDCKLLRKATVSGNPYGELWLCSKWTARRE